MTRFAALALLAGAAIASLPATQATAERRVYAGREAQALKCAAYYGYTSYVMEARGILSTSSKENATWAAVYILETHLSGTWDQRKKAYRIILERMPMNDWALFQDTARHLKWCERQFLPR